MRILLDTSAYSAFMRGHSQVVESIQQADNICLNSVVLGELLAGFMKGKHKARNEKELQTFLLSPRVEILSMDRDTSERYAAILKSLWEAGTPIPTNDIWIAASAMQHGLRIVTTDSHYQKINQVIIDLFSVES